MIGEKRFQELTERTDPSDPFVINEIAAGIRQSDGLTDIQEHLVNLMRASGGNVLEIGVRYGSSTAALLYAIERKGGHLYSVDINPCPFANAVFAGHPNWTFIQEDSKNFPQVMSHIHNGLDLLFIDGDHTFEGTLADLQNYAGHAEMVMVHDATNTSAPGVITAVSAYLATPNCRHTKCIVYPKSHGLAVLS